MSLAKSSLTIGIFTAISRVFGYVRDILIAAKLGAGSVTDAFFVALRIPNIFRSIFAEGAFNAAFIPMFNSISQQDGQPKALDFAKNVLSFLFFILLIATLAAQVLMPGIVYLIASGYAEQPDKFELTTQLTRITFPYLLLISLMTLFSGILNSIGKFAVSAVAPSLLNICLIVALLFFTSSKMVTVTAMAWAVSIAGLLQLLLVYFTCRNNGIKLTPAKPIFNKQIGKLLKNIIPVMVGSGVVQINILINTQIASYIDNAVSYLYYAERISQFPLAIIGTAIGTALLPLLSRQIKAGNREEIFTTQNKAITIALTYAIPAAVGLFILAHPIISVLFERGAFDGNAAIQSANALLAFSFGVPAFVLLKVLTNCFYANQDTRTPVIMASICIAVNLVSNLLLVPYFGHVALAISTALSAWINTVLLYVALQRKNMFYVYAQTLRQIIVIIVAAIAMGLALYFVLPMFSLSGSFLVKALSLSTLIAIGGGVYFIVRWGVGKLI